MSRAWKPRLRKAPNEQGGYPAWKAEAARLLNRNYLEPITIAERIWTQFYVRGLTPKEAADEAEVVWHRTPAPTPRLNGKSNER